MYQALYRKWRPQVFSDVVGQEHITSVLQYQTENDKLSHAYIFCGSRGTGKTTCAKLLAKAANCLNLKNGNPCNECEACRQINSGTAVDVVELDAASNNRVDEIRTLCDEVVYPPAALKKRVYIVDEVHMLTMQAFNALLKTLEEPPQHAVFILATTELQKVPATIMSRCQRFDFSRIKFDKIVDRIMYICSEEGISMEREAASVIANLSDGAMRDALSLLESCASKGGFITAEYVINFLGLSNREQLIELLYSCAKQNTVRAIAIVNELYEKNGDITSCFFELLSICRDVLIVKNVASPMRFLSITDAEFDRLNEIADFVSNDTINFFIDELKKFINSPDVFGVNKKVTAEITVIKMTSPSSVVTFDSLADRVSRLESVLKNGVIPVQDAVVQAKDKPAKAAEPTVSPSVEISSTSDFEEPEVPTTIDVSPVAPKPASTTASNKEVFEHVSDFVRKYGEKEPINKFFMEAARILLKGTDLVVITDSFGVSMLNSQRSLDTALAIAKELDPSIRSVKVKESNGNEPTESSTNSDLDSL